MNRKLIGMLTPSSNTVLEPYTARILDGLFPEVTAHFGRLPVTGITLDGDSQAQFRAEAFMEAARLLAQAQVDVMAWNGTSASWLGFQMDRDLCRLLIEQTGVPATSSVLATNELFERMDVHRFGLVTPYLEEIQRRIVDNYVDAGYQCAAERHLGDCGNFSFSEVSEALIEQMILEVADAQPDAIIILCTNLRGAEVAARIEADIGIPVLDSVSVTVWKTLLLAGVDPTRVQGWGRIFQHV